MPDEDGATGDAGDAGVSNVEEKEHVNGVTAAAEEKPADTAALETTVTEGEAKAGDEGVIQEAESSLREGLASLNYEEARALLGRLEYQKGNVEAALRVFDGIDLRAAVERLQPSSSEKASTRRGRTRSEASIQPSSQHGTSLVFEAIFLKAVSLSKLGRATEAAQECKSILDALEKIFQQGIPDIMAEQRLQETVSKTVELLPELWKQAGNFPEALASYRRALLSQWNLDDECCSRVQLRFASFLLYGGVESSPPSLGSQPEGSFAPKNNIEEAILLLMVLLKKSQWDASVMEHLTFALSLCSKTSVLARHLEEVLPGIYPRTERWQTLALCYSAAGQNEVALNLLRKSLKKYENPDDIMSLLLASKICSADGLTASEGVEYARRAIAVAEAVDEHMKCVGLRFLGSCLSKKSKVTSSDHERSCLQTEALKSLNEAIALDRQNPDIILDVGLEYAEQRNITAALGCAKDFIRRTGGSVTKGWMFLALVLSAQQKYSEAQILIDAALDETTKWDQGSLLRLKGKLKVAQSSPMEAIEAHRLLLALAQAQRNSRGKFPSSAEADNDMVSEYEVWEGLTNLYLSLSYTKDVEICLRKARSLKPYSASILQAEGRMLEEDGKIQEALVSYANGLSMDPDDVSCKVSIAALLAKRGAKFLPVARTFLSDALRLEPTNRQAWYQLGMIYKEDGRIAEAAECFQAATMLHESDPIESFRSLS